MRKLKKKARLTIYVAAAGAAGAALAFFAVKLSSPIRFVSEAPVAELGSVYDPADNIASVFMADPEDVTISGQVNTESPGTYTITYDLNGRKQTIDVLVKDTKPPKLKLKDVVADSREEVDAESFVISCQDASKVKLSIENEGSLNFTEGTRTIKVQAMDEYGNTVTESALLSRLDKSQAPVFSYEPTGRTVKAGTTFSPLELEATDQSGNPVDVTVDISQLNMGVPGVYPVYYRAEDEEGHVNAIAETVFVMGNEA